MQCSSPILSIFEDMSGIYAHKRCPIIGEQEQHREGFAGLASTELTHEESLAFQVQLFTSELLHQINKEPMVEKEQTDQIVQNILKVLIIPDECVRSRNRGITCQEN